MTRTAFAKLAILDRVNVNDFGSHPGVVVEIAPAVSIQGRTSIAASWIKVRLDDGREWSGDFKLVAFRAPRILRAA